MHAQLSAIALVTVALSAAYFMTRSMTSERWHKAGFIFWFVSIVVIFSLQGLNGISLVVLTALIVIFAPNTVEQKLPFLMLVICAVPVDLNAQIPFPGINYLITADFPVVLGIFFVAPSLLFGGEKSQYRSQSIPWSSLFMCTYFALTTFLMLRELPLTAGLRFGFEAVMGLLLIYLFIVRFAKSANAVEQMVTALIITAIMLACIGFMTQVKQWNFYSLVDSNTNLFKAAEVRYGILRTNTTVNSVLFGFIEAVGIVLLLRYREVSGRLPKYGWLMFVLLTMGFIVSMSRGAWFAGLVALGAYYLLKSRLSSSAIVAIVMSCAVLLAVFVFSNKDFSKDLDPFQTFDYRKQLYSASWDQFLSAPVLGNPLYLDSGRFDGLVQGEGIVDVVSAYLQIVLQFGLAGLLLYIATFLAPLVGTLRLRNSEIDVKSRTLIASLGSIVLGYLAMISTVSAVNLIFHFGLILVALANAALVVVKLQLKLAVNTEVGTPTLTQLTPIRKAQAPIRKAQAPLRRAPGRGRNLHG